VSPPDRSINEHPDIFWGVIASMVVGNVILLTLNIPLVRIFIRILDVRVGVLASLAAVATMLGVYSINNSVFDLWIVLAFGVLGYAMRKVGFEPGPMVLAFVLGGLLEPSVRQALLISGGDPTIFFTRPISGSMIGIVVLVLLLGSLRRVLRRSRSRSRTNSGSGPPDPTLAEASK